MGCVVSRYGASKTDYEAESRDIARMWELFHSDQAQAAYVAERAATLAGRDPNFRTDLFTEQALKEQP